MLRAQDRIALLDAEEAEELTPIPLVRSATMEIMEKETKQLELDHFNLLPLVLELLDAQVTASAAPGDPANAAAVQARMDVLRRRLDLCERLVLHCGPFETAAAEREGRALEMVARRDALLQTHGIDPSRKRARASAIGGDSEAV